MFSIISTGLKVSMAIIAVAFNVGCCVVYASFDPGMNVLIHLIFSTALLLLSLTAGFVFSAIRPKYLFAACFSILFVIAALWTVFVEDVLIFIPLPLFSLTVAYFMVKPVVKK